MVFGRIGVVFVFILLYASHTVTAQCAKNVMKATDSDCFELELNEGIPIPDRISDLSENTFALSKSLGSHLYVYTNSDCEGEFYNYSGSLLINDGVCTYQQGILPVQFLEYGLREQNTDLVFDWVTVEEINHDYFVVEKWDGEQFVQVSRHAESDRQEGGRKYYSYVEPDIEAGTHTYRLVQLDLDGTKTLHHSIHHHIETKGFVAFIHKGRHLEVNYSRRKRVQVYDLYFEKVIDQVVQEGTIDISALSSGIYVYMLIDGGIDHVEKFYVP